MIKVHYPERINGFDEYETLARRRKAKNETKKRYRNEKNDKNGSARYEYFYSDEELFSFVPIVKFIKNAGKRCQIFFNNHPKGYGAQNALKLKEMLQS